MNENTLPPRATSRCTRSRARLPLTTISRISLTIQKFLVKKLCRSATLCSIHEISILSQAGRACTSVWKQCRRAPGGCSRAALRLFAQAVLHARAGCKCTGAVAGGGSVYTSMSSGAKVSGWRRQSGCRPSERKPLYWLGAVQRLPPPVSHCLRVRGRLAADYKA